MDPQGATRRETVVAGIAGVSLGQIERTVPADEAPPLAPNADLTQIGKSVPRWNGRQKVTGAVRFTADINLPGLLHARLLRSPLPHARIRAIETGAAERHPGVRAVQVLLGPAGGGRHRCRPKKASKRHAASSSRSRSTPALPWRRWRRSRRRRPTRRCA